jgi:hypothetical protein
MTTFMKCRQARCVEARTGCSGGKGIKMMISNGTAGLQAPCLGDPHHTTVRKQKAHNKARHAALTALLIHMLGRAKTIIELQYPVPGHHDLAEPGTLAITHIKP